MQQTPTKRFQMVNEQYALMRKEAHEQNNTSAVNQLEAVNDLRNQLIIQLYREGFFKKPENPKEKALFENKRAWSEISLMILQEIEDTLQDITLALYVFVPS